MQDLPSSQYHELCQKSVFVRLKVCEAPNPFGASLPRFWLQFELLSGGETFFWNPVKCSGNATPNRFVTGHTRPSVPSSLCCDLQSHLDEFSALHDQGIPLSTGDGDISRTIFVQVWSCRALYVIQFLIFSRALILDTAGKNYLDVLAPTYSYTSLKSLSQSCFGVSRNVHFAVGLFSNRSLMKS